MEGGKLPRHGRETVNYNSDNETESPRLISSSGSPTKRSASNFDIKGSREMVKDSHNSGTYKKAKKKKDTTPENAQMTEEQIETYKKINHDRTLYGQSLNANKKDMNDWPLVINVLYTQYEVLQDCADETNFRLSTEEEEDWDVWWIDGPILPTLLTKMKPYQRTNHLPACYVLARKNLLATNL